MDVVDKGISSIVGSLENRGVSFEGKSVLVTGGAGFLGSWICDVLVRQDANVICVDNFVSGLRENIQHLFDKDNFSLVEHDISQPIYFDKKIDVVLHLASRASPLEFRQFPIQILKANTLGIWVALGIAKKHSARLLYTSSSEIYGDPDPKFIPTPETYHGNVDPIGPRSCYDEAKRSGEAFATAYRVQHDLDVRIVRIFNTYGPRLRAGNVYGRVVARFIDQALNNRPITIFGDGTQTRSFAYVTDMIEGLLTTAYLPEAEGEVFNIGYNEETRIIDLARVIKELTHSSSPVEYHPLPMEDPKRRCPDLTKAWKLLGWKPKVPLRQGLKDTIVWFREKQIYLERDQSSI